MDRAGQTPGTIRSADGLRPEAKAAVAVMQKMGLKVVLLSGDTQGNPLVVGQAFVVGQAMGEFLPDGKAKWIHELRGKNREVAMVGDEINNAPAPLEPDVGVAMGSGTDVARESGDVILIGCRIDPFVP